MRLKSLIILFEIMLILLGIAGVFHASEKAWHEQLDGRILEVNSVRVESQNDMEYIFDGLKIDETINLKISENGIIKQVESKTIPFYSSDYLITQIIVGFLFIAIAFIVFLKNPKDKASLVFHWGAISIGMVILTTWGKYNIEPNGLGYVLRTIFSTAYAFVGTLFLHFTFVFPRRRLPQLQSKMKYLYSFSLLLSISSGAAFIYATHPFSIENFQIFDIIFSLTRIYLMLCGLGSVVSLVHSYYSSVKESDRQKLRWILLGLLIGPPSFMVLWVLPQLFGASPFIAESLVLYLIIIVPITFAIAIVKHKAFNIDIIINRGSVYTIVTFAVIIIYALFIGIVSQFVGVLTVKSSIVASSVASVVIALLFVPLKYRVQLFVDKKFFHVKYNYRTAQKKITEIIHSGFDINDIAGQIFVELNAFVPIERIALFAKQEMYPQLSLIASSGFDSVNELLRIEELLTLRESQLERLSAFQDKIEAGANCDLLQAETEMDSNLLAMILPIKAEDSGLLGFLVLGDRKSKRRYNIEDVDLIHSIAIQIGIAINRINLQNKLLLEKAESKRLHELNQLKTYFVSSVSHELKTPLTSIVLFAEILQSMKVPQDKAIEYLGIIKGESMRLSRLIENVLDFAKIEKGTKNYNFDELKLNSLLDEVLKSMQYQLSFQKFKVVNKITEEDLYINADKDAVTETIINLLSNAVKYSGETKMIEIELFKQNDFAVIGIKDSGIGISEEDQARLFEPFFRSQNTSAQRAGGTGLGLAVVKHIMDAHRGRVEIESQIGKGSKFILLFPLADNSSLPENSVQSQLSRRA